MCKLPTTNFIFAIRCGILRERIYEYRTNGARKEAMGNYNWLHENADYHNILRNAENRDLQTYVSLCEVPKRLINLSKL